MHSAAGREKTRLLFAITQFFKGGAEVALLNLFCALSPGEYEIDFVLLNQLDIPGTISLVPQVPGWVNVIDIVRLCTGGAPASVAPPPQKVNVALSKAVEGKHYHWAFHIGEWSSPEFVASMVQAERKAAWIHNDLDAAEYFNGEDFFRWDKQLTHYIFVAQRTLEKSATKYPQLIGKSSCVHNLLNVAAILQQAKEPLGEDERYFTQGLPVVVTIANVRTQKNHRRALEAMLHLRRKGLPFIWLNIGALSDAAIVAGLRKKIAEDGLEDYFILLGARENPYRYLARAAAFALASNYESWPLVLAEALLLGIPVVATKTSGALAQVTPENGILADFNPVSVADALARILRGGFARHGIPESTAAMPGLGEFQALVRGALSIPDTAPQKDSRRIVYTMDDVNYPGGAHVATFAQMEFVHHNMGWRVAIISLTQPKEALRARLPFVEFITSDVLTQIKPDDVVCVPFESSRFRQGVAALQCAWKVQWVHIDYAHWSNLDDWTRNTSANDGTLYQNFDRIAFVSQMSQDGFLARYPHLAPKCRVCHNLMNVESIRRFAQEDGAPLFSKKRRPKLVTVARLNNQHKGILRSLRVARRLREAGQDFEWLFVGSAIPDEELLYRNFVRKARLAGRVRFVGNLENPFPAMHGADLFCLFSHFEGLPNTIYESLIVGTPVMATDVGAVAEQIGPETGWLVEDDEDAIFERLSAVLAQPEKLLQMRQNLQGYLYSNTDIQRRIKAILHPAQQGAPDAAAETGPLVSVIVPVYNVQDYLDECLASLEAQTLENIEIIMVNDGSTDDSGEIMDRYARRYPGKFVRYDKENGGPGAARNFGATHARAKYVAFVDSDDFVDTDMLEQMLSLAEQHNCDIVQCGIMMFDNNDDYRAVERAPFGEEGLIPPKELMLRATRPVAASPCTKLYRKSLFDTLQFPHIWYEDLSLLPILYSYLESSFYWLPQPFYHYRWGRKGSIQNSNTSPRTYEIITAQQNILDMCNPAWQTEVEYTVYDHTCRTMTARPFVSPLALAFAQRHAARFAQNPYVQRDIAAGLLPDLLPKADAHPKIIHTCRFKGAPLSAAAQACQGSWQKYLPGYTLREWTEQDALQSESAYVQEALAQKDWPAVAGYLAGKALYQEGGVYLDAGTLLKQPFTDALGYSAVLPLAGEELASWEVAAAAPGHPLFADILALYQNAEYCPGQAQANFETIRRGIYALLEPYGIAPIEGAQALAGGVVVYPATALLIDVGEAGNLAELTCDGFSAEDATAAPVRHLLQKQYYLARYAKPAPPAPPADNTFSGTPLEVANAVVRRYGVVFMVRALARRLLAVLRGRGGE